MHEASPFNSIIKYLQASQDCVMQVKVLEFGLLQALRIFSHDEVV